MNKVTEGIPQGFWKLLRWAVTIVAFGYLYYEIFVKHDSQEIAHYAQNAFVGKWRYLLLVGLLMPLNWCIEGFKWRMLLTKFYDLPFLQAIKGILMGISVGIFTPNGIGEFAGRMLVVPNRTKQASVSATIVGNMAQLAITITMGGACLVFFIGNLITQNMVIWVSFAAVTTVIIGFFLYFRLPQIARLIFNRIQLFNRFDQFVSAFSQFNRSDLTKAYFLSLLRYLVFCFQLFVLLRTTVSFVNPIEDLQLFFLVPVYYYVQTVIPTISLGELGIRGAMLLFILPEAQNSVSIVMCTAIIWMINLIIPALTGLVLSFFTKLKPQTA